MKHLFVLVISFLFPVFMMGQKHMTWDEFVDYVTQDEEQTESEEWLQHLEDLEQMATHPININTASKADLSQLLFLSDRQIDDIRDYVTRYHGMKTIYELQLIASLDYFEKQALPLFLFAGESDSTLPPKIGSMLKQQHHELQTRFDFPLYHRDGFLHENGYRGTRFYNRTKYRFSATNHLSASFHIEKDQGERGIDSYGGQIMIRDFGHLVSFVLGDYKLGFGEGLVINQGFSMGKSSLLSRPSQGVRAYTGTDEVNFLRGAAATLCFSDFNVTAFVSHRAMDATLMDSTENVKTIVSTGYHRTQTEWEKKNNFHETTAGANLIWSNHDWHFGATGYFLHTDRILEPGDVYYRKISPSGQSFGVVGTNYGYEAYRWQLRGETAYSTEKGGLATLNKLSYRVNAKYQLSVSQRYYNYHYYSFFSSALCDNSSVQNETAGTIQLEALPLDGLRLMTYADFFYNPWPRYGLTHSSSGQEAVMFLQYSIKRKNEISLRYSFKNKEYNTERQYHHRVRLQWITKPTKDWRCQTTAMLHFVQGSQGFGIGETVHYGQGQTHPIRFALSGIYFYTTDYNSRIYLYEPNVSNTLSIPSFFGHGVRGAGTLSWALWHRRLLFELKYGVTCYFDRDTQSSELQTIYSNVKNDITLQCRIRV